MTLQYIHESTGVTDRLEVGLDPRHHEDLLRKVQDILDKLDPSIVPPARKTKL